jgi:hypothetical protein
LVLLVISENPNVKVQIPNEIQMSKLKCQMKSKFQNPNGAISEEAEKRALSELRFCGVAVLLCCSQKRKELLG